MLRCSYLRASARKARHIIIISMQQETIAAVFIKRIAADSSSGGGGRTTEDWGVIEKVSAANGPTSNYYIRDTSMIWDKVKMRRHHHLLFMFDLLLLFFGEIIRVVVDDPSYC